MKRVLVVDDDESIVDAVSLVLQDLGYIVDATTKGEEIYQKIAFFSPDVILLDLLISGSDGGDICKKLKETVETSKIPVIMISAHPNAGKAAVAAGAENFLAKPFDMGELMGKLEQVLHSHD